MEKQITEKCTLSRIESEHVSLSELSREIMFVIRIGQFMGVKIKFPVEVKVDNAGAIFLANNKALGQRAKHIDTRYHFVREFVEDRIIKIGYVKAEYINADIMTKTQAERFFGAIARNLCTAAK